MRLADGNALSAGDIIVTRHNNRRLAISRSNWVKNGDRWRVDKSTATAPSSCAHLELGRTVTLPADYVAEHVQLGYATTVHGAQGMTADTAHVVATGEETRQHALRRALPRRGRQPPLPQRRRRRRPPQPHRTRDAPPADRDRHPDEASSSPRRIAPLRHHHAAGARPRPTHGRRRHAATSMP